jgi:phage shock protein PspC (stress-responsive transcriptional regulator)
VARRRLVRPRKGRWIAGVCAGIAERFDTSPLLVRILFVASTIIPGPQFIVYLALWIFIPSED